jgi:hypothetical protein
MDKDKLKIALRVSVLGALSFEGVVMHSQKSSKALL